MLPQLHVGRFLHWYPRLLSCCKRMNRKKVLTASLSKPRKPTPLTFQYSHLRRIEFLDTVGVTIRSSNCRALQERHNSHLKPQRSLSI